MAKDSAYYEKINIENEQKLRVLIKELPPFCKQFFISLEGKSASRTRIAYALDLQYFFQYMHDNNPLLAKYEVSQFPLSILDAITSSDIEEYIYYLKLYEKDGIARTNDERSIKRKLSCLRTFYQYYYKNEMIDTNPAIKVDLPKIHEKPIIRLDMDEVAELLDKVESGENLTKKQQGYHERTKVRDLAILTLLLGTGMRVSECVGIDINDLDFKNNGVKIHRKGGNEVIVYFGDEVKEALQDYLEERMIINADPDSESALFLSLQRKRISVRAVEKLVKKYASLVTNVKKITPHKLRSTYGTHLYEQTGDIYLVADVLGHSDVNTTRKHYAQLEDSRRRQAVKYVKLRDE